MPQGIKIVKEGFDISTQDPRNIALDTTAVSSLKRLPTLFIHLIDKNITERYVAQRLTGPGTYSYLTMGRIRIPHNLGFPPGYQAWITNDATSDTKSFPQVQFFDDLEIETFSDSLLITGIDLAMTGNEWIALNIIAENLEAYTV